LFEILISSRETDTDLKKSGDILVAKPLGSPWGTEEIDFVITYEDAEIEEQLNHNPVICFPYAVRSEGVV
jgi:hypothetical protein